MKKKPKYSNIPLLEAEERMRVRVAEGWTCFQKFTCAGCGQRLTMDVPNQLFAKGTCDKCSAVTDIARDGCGFMATTLPAEVVQAAVRKRGLQ